MKVSHKSYAGLLVKNLLLGTLAIAVSISPAVLSEALADPLDKSSPKIAHGMYKEIDKSSPKIAHGMYKDRGKSSPKIAERTLQSQRNRLHEEIKWAIETGRLTMADEMLFELDNLNRAGR